MMLPPISTFLCDCSDQCLLEIPMPANFMNNNKNNNNIQKENILLNEQENKSPEKRTKCYRQKFTVDEDNKLKSIICRLGTKDWNAVSRVMGTKNPRQCRERWRNYLNPTLKNEEWTLDEDIILVQKYKEYGSRWSKIAKFLRGRSVNSLRNRWQALLKNIETKRRIFAY